MPKFKVGDRVRITAGHHKGRTGTVRESSNAPWVHCDDCRPELYDEPIRELSIQAGYAWCESEDHLEPLTDQALSITKEQVLAIAATSEEAAKMMRAGYPECFPAPGPEYLEFVDGQQLTSGDLVPPFIGHGLAPKDMRNKCLMVNANNYEIVTGKEGRYVWVAFRKKN